MAASARLRADCDLALHGSVHAAARHHFPPRIEDPHLRQQAGRTTGEPKGVVRDNGGHAVALRWSMKNIYGVEPSEQLLFAGTFDHSEFALALIGYGKPRSSSRA